MFWYRKVMDSDCHLQFVRKYLLKIMEDDSVEFWDEFENDYVFISLS